METCLGMISGAWEAAIGDGANATRSLVAALLEGVAVLAETLCWANT